MDVATHPAWTLGVMGKYLTTIGMPKHENYPAEFQGTITAASRTAHGNGGRLIELGRHRQIS